MRARLSLLGAAAATAALTFGLVSTSGRPAGASSTSTRSQAPVLSPSDKAEGDLVANEDTRLIDIRKLAVLAQAHHLNPSNAPYRVRSNDSSTLILTPRTAPYTLADLLQLGPQTLAQQPNGSYLLSENLYVDRGATLTLTASSAPLKLLMKSDPTGFVSIVSFNGSLDFEGTGTAPITITSYDPSTGGPDTDLTDGRAYIRGVGGSVTMSYVHASDLGFWSGRTGGLAITSNSRPSIARPHIPRPRTRSQNPAPTNQLYGKNQHPGHQAVKPANQTPATTVPPQVVPSALPADPISGSIQTSGSGAGWVDLAAPTFQSVAGSVTHSTFDGDAFGLFLSGAKNFVVTDSAFTHSLYSGLVVHRYVTGAQIQRDTSSYNAENGFEVARGASGVQLLNDIAERNGLNGFSINGEPLGTAQSAGGMPLNAYGGHLVASSTATGNGKVGIEVIGALDTVVRSNTVSGSPMGIVVRGSAGNVQVINNRLSNLAKHGISIRDGVTGATINANTVVGAGTPVYVRNSVARITGNALTGGSKHSISLLGTVGHTVIAGNTIRGQGNAPIDVRRVVASSVSVGANNVAKWLDLRTWTLRLYSPLTLLWISIVLLIGFTALRGRRPRTAGHPNSNSIPLQVMLAGESLKPDLALAGAARVRAELLPVVDIRDGADSPTESVRPLWTPGGRPLQGPTRPFPDDDAWKWPTPEREPADDREPALVGTRLPSPGAERYRVTPSFTRPNGIVDSWDWNAAEEEIRIVATVEASAFTRPAARNRSTKRHKRKSPAARLIARLIIRRWSRGVTVSG